MNEQEFLNGVRRKINILEKERRELELIRMRQKRLLYRKIKIGLIPFCALSALVISILFFEIGIVEIAVISVSILMFMIWMETYDFEIENTDAGVRLNEYSHK
ncbi:MAG TPA: hypothetical protein PK033_03240 [Acetivibrio sp.]|jgi:hypothetical protein|nr:hypothetical protein [Clostridium sp.]HQA56873.1 hypothetical protein [Acetivibrio sp.]